MKNFIIGIIIGITSLIPGISAGTIIYVTDEFDYITSIIADYKNNIKNIFFMIIGILIGVITFSKIVELLFVYLPFETIYLFIGFLLYNFKETLKLQKNLNIIYLSAGILIIYILSLFATTTNPVITNYPEISFTFLIIFGLCGCLDGFLTITPGISGSMVMMILGPYYLYKSYLANVTNNISFIIPLLCYLIGDIIGIYLGSKFSKIMLKKYKYAFTNIIIGMVLISIILLIPKFFSISCLLSLILGYSLIKKIKK